VAVKLLSFRRAKIPRHKQEQTANRRYTDDWRSAQRAPPTMGGRFHDSNPVLNKPDVEQLFVRFQSFPGFEAALFMAFIARELPCLIEAAGSVKW
jgi:hypothetical protein